MQLVDLILLKQQGQVVPQPVLDALERQGDVKLNIFVLTGERLSSDRNRLDAICRARNKSRSMGGADKVFLLDSDVVLPDGAIEHLVSLLDRYPQLGGVAVDYLREAAQPMRRHVGMGATLFRRQALTPITFRWESDKCECLCCCEDLRKLGWHIEYASSMRAEHLRPVRIHSHDLPAFGPSSVPSIVNVCTTCGTQYLVPSPCCGQATIERPLLFYTVAQSAHQFANIEFSIIMLTKNNVELTRTSVESLLKDCPTETVEFIFVDDGSTDETVSYLKDLSLRCQVKFIQKHPHEPFVYARANNRGAWSAVGKYLLLVNNDVEVLGEKMYELLRRALSTLKVGAAGVAWFPHEARSEEHLVEFGKGFALAKLPLPGHFWAVRRDVYWEIGGMDEAFSGYGVDEVETQYRLLKANYMMAVLDLPVRHEQLATYPRWRSKEEFASMRRQNAERFVLKHGRSANISRQGIDPFRSHTLPEISIAIATGDYGHFLRECFDSILACQNPTGCPWQVVVVDNGSTDDTPAILHEYRNAHPGVFNLIRLNERTSVAAAKNIAMDRCIGKYIALLDSDDQFLPQKLQVCYRVLEETRCDLVYHDFFLNGPGAPKHPMSALMPQAPLRDMRMPSTWVFRNGKVRFNEQMIGGAEDLEWYSRVWSSLRTVYIRQPLLLYRQHENQLSGRPGTPIVNQQVRESVQRKAVTR